MFPRTSRARPQICSEVIGLRFVGHGGTAALFVAEVFLRLPALRCVGGWRISRAIFFERRGDERENAEVLCVAGRVG